MKKVFFLSLAIFIIAIQSNGQVDNNTDGLKQEHAAIGLKPEPTAMWDMLFSWSTNTAYETGVVCIGDYIYTAQWQIPYPWIGHWFHKYSKTSGTLVESFNIDGLTGVRDFAFDGTHAYAANASSTIYKIDLSAHTIISTISSSVGTVRHIAYDPVNNGFWTGDWTTMRLIDAVTGAWIANGPAMNNATGSAYDPDPAGPFVWVQSQSGPSNCELRQYKITGTSLSATDVVKDVSTFQGYPSGGIAGGLESIDHAGKFGLLGVVQGLNWIYATELYDLTPGVLCPGFPTVSYGSKVYNTLLLGNQCWLKENLNIGIRIDGPQEQTDNGVIEKYCYTDDDANCAIYGGLYQWNELMQYVTNEGVQGICPTGWHLPSDDEWCTLTQYIDPTVICTNPGMSGTDVGIKMKSSSGWYNNGNGTNASGFNALPGGYLSNGSFFFITKVATFWATTYASYPGMAWSRDLDDLSDGVYRWQGDKTSGKSARCLKDCSEPSTPTTGTHITEATQIIWNWSAVSGASGYKWNTTNNPASAIDMGTTTTKTEIGLACNTSYTRYAWAYNACGYSTAVTLIAVTSLDLPSVPIPGTHIPSATQVIWNWNPVSGATGYKWNTTNDYSTATDMGINTSKPETGLSCNTTYTRYAWAYNTCGNSITATLTETTLNCGMPVAPCPGIPTMSYAGLTYNTIQIGTQCWIKENLNVGTRIDLSIQQTDNGIIEKYCYNDLESNCYVYGGLYQRDEMIRYLSSSQGICPTGWHIPNLDKPEPNRKIVSCMNGITNTKVQERHQFSTWML